MMKDNYKTVDTKIRENSNPLTTNLQNVPKTTSISKSEILEQLQFVYFGSIRKMINKLKTFESTAAIGHGRHDLKTVVN